MVGQRDGLFPSDLLSLACILLLFTSEMSTHSLLVRPACLVTHQSLQLPTSVTHSRCRQTDCFWLWSCSQKTGPAEDSRHLLKGLERHPGTRNTEGELEEVSLPPTPASLLGAGQGQLPRGREPSKAPGNLVGLGRLSSGGQSCGGSGIYERSREGAGQRGRRCDGAGAGSLAVSWCQEELRACQRNSPKNASLCSDFEWPASLRCPWRETLSRPPRSVMSHTAPDSASSRYILLINGTERKE